MKVIFNPNCSKCKTLEETLESHSINWEKVEYLTTGLSQEMILDLFDRYDGDWRNLIREKENVFKDAGLNPREMDKNEMVEFLVKHPVAIQRPLVIKDKKIVIARNDDGIQKVMS